MKLFRHKRVSRFRLGEFEFKHHKLALDDTNGDAKKKIPSDAEKFLGYVAQLPKREQIQIVEIDAKAQQQLEKPAARAVRGVMGSGKIDTPAEKAGPNRPRDESLETIGEGNASGGADNESGSGESDKPHAEGGDDSADDKDESSENLSTTLPKAAPAAPTSAPARGSGPKK